MNLLKKRIPLLETIQTYPREDFRSDLAAGLTVGIMLVPQGMAYAFLAGMPPIYGLYGGLIPLILYAIFGTSKQMSIGPVAISAILVLAGISQLAEPGSEVYVQLVITAGLLIGIFQACLALIRLGFLVNFLSHPVIVGFTSAAAIIIAVNQLKDALGFKIPRFERIYEMLAYAIEHLHQTNWITLTICLASILIIRGLKKLNKSIPGPLIVVVIGTLLTYTLRLDLQGVDIIRSVPQGLPAFMIPDLSWETIEMLLPTVATVTIIGVVESISIARALESKHKEHSLRANQELLALGLSKIGGAFFQALPTSGSFSRSAVNSNAGAKSTVASLITAALIMLTLIFLTPLFFYLPKAILAAIIILAVYGLFDFKEAKYLWHYHRPDFWMMLVTFLVTLVLGIEIGVMAGVGLSIFIMLYLSARPHMAVLGRMPGTNYYRNVDRFKEAIPPEEGMIVRFDDQLYFGNSTFFRDKIKDLVERLERPIQFFYLDARSIHQMDSSGLNTLREIHEFLKGRGIQLVICGAIGPIRDLFLRTGFLEELGAHNHFLYLHDALQFHNQIIEKSTT